MAQPGPQVKARPAVHRPAFQGLSRQRYFMGLKYIVSLFKLGFRRMAPDHEQAASQLPVDFGRAAPDYGLWRQGFPPEFFRRIEALGVGLSGQRILDLGTGTGLLARAFAQRGCLVTGLDLSAALLAEARKADRAANLSIDYLEARAETTGLPDGAFDVVSAATCWHWFDRPKVAVEARRVLRPAGRLLIASLDWHSRPGNIVEITGETIRRLSPAPPAKTQNTFQYPDWTKELTAAGFDDWDAFAFTTQLSYSHAAWRGRVRASAAVGPAMDRQTLARFDRELEQALEREFPGGPLLVDHRVFALVAWSRMPGT